MKERNANIEYVLVIDHNVLSSIGIIKLNFGDFFEIDFIEN